MLAAVVAVAALAHDADAANLTWDPAQNQSNAGGAGVWNGSNLFWNDDNAAPNVALNNSADTGIFAGTGGIVTGLNVQANGIRFSASNYTLQGSNSDLTLNAGGITIDSGVSGTSFLNIRRILLNTATFTNTDLATFTNSPIVINGSGKTLTINNPAVGGTTTFGNFSATQSANNGNVLNTINGSGNVTISGDLGAAGNFGTPIASNTTTTNTLAYAGTGTLRLDGNNINYRTTGAGGVVNFRLTSGTLALGHNNALGAFSDIANTVATTSTFELNGGTVVGTAARNVANRTILTANSVIGGTNAFTLSGSLTNSGGNRTLTVDNSAATNLSGNVYLAEADTSRTLTLSGTGNTTIGGVIANNNSGNTAASGLTKTGAGTLTLGNAGNGFTGVTTISGGTLSVNTLANGGIASSIGASSNAAGNLVLNGGGTLAYTGGSVTSDRNFTVGSGGGLISVSNSLTSLVLAGASTGGNTLTKSGSGSLEMTGAVGGSSGAALTVQSGTVTLSGSADNSYLASNVTSGTLVLGKNSNSGVHALGGDSTVGVDGTMKLGGTGGDQIYDNAILTVNGVFDMNGLSEKVKSISGAGTFLNTGSTQSTLSVSGFGGSSTFNGIITGNIALSHSDGGSSTTLNGLNTYSGNTTIGSSTASLLLGSTSGLAFYPTANGISNWINGVAGATVEFDGLFTFDLANAAIADGNSWNIVEVGDLVETFGSSFAVSGFTEASNVWSRVDGNNTWTFNESTGALSLAVVPEPGAALLGGIGILALMRRRRC